MFTVLLLLFTVLLKYDAHWYNTWTNQNLKLLPYNQNCCNKVHYNENRLCVWWWWGPSIVMCVVTEHGLVQKFKKKKLCIYISP